MNVGFAYALAAAVTWGMVYTIDQKILTSVSPFSLLFIDSVITAIIMLPFFFVDHAAIRSVINVGKFNLALILISIILATAANFFIYSGIKLVGAPSASIIEIAYPFFVLLFSIFLYDASPSIPFFIGGLLIFIGSALITYFH